MRKRRDNTHTEIKRAFHISGWSVMDTADIGNGAPDLMVAKHGITIAVEIKSEKGKLREKQLMFERFWNGRYTVCRTVDDVMALNKLIVKI